MTLAACAGTLAPPTAEGEELPCAAALSQREAEACWSVAARSAEAAVDAHWAQVAAAVRAAGAADADRLREAREAWLRYRDDHCSLYTLRLSGGSAASTAGAVCHWRLARERMAELLRLSEAWGNGR